MVINVPVLVAAQNVRPATASEALALSILHGDPIVPGEIVAGTSQQSFLDARMRGHEEVDQPVAKDHPIRRNDFRLFRKTKRTSGRLALRSLARFLKEKKKEKISVKMPEISVRLQVPPHHEAQRAGGLRPQQPVHRREPSVPGLESRSQSHREIREDHQVRLQHHGRM